ncbi:uncharacterized protein EI97DRAFT_254905 [Westerdykella ornata]|uniref:Uncharacterized protein n=1 Tax=Westerdykella ornata TaxID=318751 RepID=A0A6A6JQA4_WESOR|nr:uncharacterized protein EI97DRAFT_254905 [Westerdykella ornata]KAF2278445.1 hypothetical protein EI97DRAFT_254905 [Westerdykella ornata]
MPGVGPNVFRYSPIRQLAIFSSSALTLSPAISHLLPSHLPPLCPHLVLEVIQEAGSRPPVAVLGLQRWQSVDAAMGFGDEAVEARGADECGDGIGFEEGEEGSNHVGVFTARRKRSDGGGLRGSRRRKPVVGGGSGVVMAPG